jgi:hypothetical protein
VVYVSSSQGNDANDGLSESTPKASIPAGFALLRNGHGDHLRLRRGDGFSLSYLIWMKSGASAQEPMVLSAYGSGPRPIVDPGPGEAIHITPGFRSANTVRHVAISGVSFVATRRDFNRPDYDISRVSPTGLGIRIVGVETTAAEIVEDLLIEDCSFVFLGQGIVLEGPYLDSVRNVRLRRNVIADTYSTHGHTNGVYVSNVRGLSMEENIVDGVQRAPGMDPAQSASALSHAVYVQSTARDITLRNNIFARAFDGGMMRPGGIYEGNLVVDVLLGNHQGFMWSESAPIILEGVDAQVRGNAFLKLGSGQGINVGNIRSGVISNNLLLSGARTGGNGIWLLGLTPFGQIGVHDLLIEANYVLGLQGLTSFGNAVSSVSVRDNLFRSSNTNVATLFDYPSGGIAFSNNTYLSQRPPRQWFSINGTSYSLAGWSAAVGEPSGPPASFVDPASAPDVESYHASIGGPATLDSFLKQARGQSRARWRDEYTAAAVIAYLRSQLGLGAP